MIAPFHGPDWRTTPQVQFDRQNWTSGYLHRTPGGIALLRPVRLLPTQRRSGRVRTPVLLATACVVLLATSGCIFLRVLEIRRQLSEFDANFVVDVEDGLTVTFLHPVLLEKDFHLVGLPPSQVEPDENGADWTHTFEKQYPDSRTEDSNFDLALSSRFTGGKLSVIHIEEKYFAFVPKENVLLTIRSFGNADLDVSERKASMEVSDEDPSPGIPPPDLLDILNTLGLPYARDDSNGERWFEYLYRLKPSISDQAKEESGKNRKIYQLRFTFSKRDRIQKIDGTLPLLGKVHISYD